MSFFVYVLHSQKHDRLYIGQTANILARLESHMCLSEKGYTAKFRPWKVIYVETVSSRSLAMIREKELKGGKGREWIRSRFVQ